MMLNGLVLGYFRVRLVQALYVHKGFSRLAWIALVIAVAPIALMLFSQTPEWKVYWYSASSLLAVAVLCDAPWQLFKEKSPGVVEIKMYAAYMLTSFMWAIYAWFYLKDIAVFFWEAISVFIYLGTIALYFYYKRNTIGL